MASAGTIAAPSIDFRFRPDRGREEELITGYVRGKSQFNLDAADLGLRTIKNFVFTPYASNDIQGGETVLYGSVNTRGSLMNTVTFNALRGSTKFTPTQGTFHYGTIRSGGTYQLGFMAIGA